MADGPSAAGAKAGWHLWLVGAIGIFWNAFGCFDFLMSVTRNEAYLAAYPKEMLDHLFAQPWWSWAMWAVGVFGGLAGIILLLMKRALAVPLLAASFLAALASTIIGSMDANLPRAEGTDPLPFIIVALAFGFVAYAYWQSRRGVLR